MGEEDFDSLKIFCNDSEFSPQFQIIFMQMLS